MEEVQQPPAKIPKLSEGEEEQERIIKLLEERLEKHDENRKAVQDKLHEICEGLRTQVNELEDRINKELEEKFTSEDNRLQTALNELCGNRSINTLQKTKTELLMIQSYEIIENKEDEEEEEEEDDDDDDDDENDTVKPKLDLTTLYKLKTERRIVPELVKIRKPTNISVIDVNKISVSVKFTYFNSDEERILSYKDILNPVKCKCSLFKKGNEQERKEYLIDENKFDSSSFFTLTPYISEVETTYGIRVKMVVGGKESEWSDEVAEFTTPEFKEYCVWKKCPDDVNDDKKYSVDEKNPRIATKINDDYCCTIIGDTYIPLNKVTSWNIKIHKSRNNGYGIFIGTAPNDINQNVKYNDSCGWYFYCYSSTLYSGPPHSYSGKEYGPRKDYGDYVHTGDSVGVVVDTTKGELSFALNGTNLGVAYEGIPLDKPLVPCVVLYYQGDSVELIF